MSGASALPFTMPSGTVQSWMADEGFGMVTSDEGGEEVFVPVSVLSSAKGLEVGARVEYEVAWDDREGKMLCSSCIGVSFEGKSCDNGDDQDGEEDATFGFEHVILEVASESSESFEIFGSFGAVQVTFVVVPDTTIDELMLELVNTFGWVSNKVRLTFMCKELELGQALKDYGVKADSTICILMRGSGGGEKKKVKKETKVNAARGKSQVSAKDTKRGIRDIIDEIDNEPSFVQKRVATMSLDDVNALLKEYDSAASTQVDRVVKFSMKYFIRDVSVIEQQIQEGECALRALYDMFMLKFTEEYFDASGQYKMASFYADLESRQIEAEQESAKVVAGQQMQRQMMLQMQQEMQKEMQRQLALEKEKMRAELIEQMRIGGGGGRGGGGVQPMHD